MSSHHILRTADGLEVLVAGPVCIGRGEECQLRLDDPLISRLHARVWASGRRLFLTDEGSTNGTFLNETPVQGTVRLRPEDVVRVGSTRLYVLASGQAGRPALIVQRGGLWVPVVFLGTLLVLAACLAAVRFGGSIAARIFERLDPAASPSGVWEMLPEGGEPWLDSGGVIGGAADATAARPGSPPPDSTPGGCASRRAPLAAGSVLPGAAEGPPDRGT